MKPKLALLRDRAIELMSKEREYEEIVEPELTSINTRWESVVTTIRVRINRLSFYSVLRFSFS